jgi:hypothetical protein
MTEIAIVCLLVANVTMFALMPKSWQEYESRDWENRIEQMDRAKKDFSSGNSK